MPTQTGSTIDHVIGPEGSVTLKVPAGGVTVQGIDGDAVHLSSPTGRDLTEDYRIETGEGRLELSIRETTGFAWLSGRRFDPLHAEVPHGATIRIDTASGSVHIDGLRGEQHYRAASGSIGLTNVAGEITVDHVSGDVKVRGSGPVSLAARTVSGDVNASAPIFDKIHSRTMSGSIRIAGRLVGDGPFSIESVSGDVSIELDGPARIDGVSVAGSIRTDLLHRAGGPPGHRTIEIGEAGPQVAFRTVSGELRVTGPKTGQGDTEAAPPSAEPSAAEPLAPPAPASSTTLEALAARRLAVLQDLEHGRIEIDDASARLADIDAEEERAQSRSRAFDIGPLHGELRWDHRA